MGIFGIFYDSSGVFFYELINGIRKTMKSIKLLEYMQSYVTSPFYMQFVRNLPIMQCFKDIIKAVFTLLFYFKGPKPSNYARDPISKLLLFMGK